MVLKLELLDSEVGSDVGAFSAITWSDSDFVSIQVQVGVNQTQIFPWDGTSLGTVDATNGTNFDRMAAFSTDGTKIAINFTPDQTVKAHNFTSGGLGSLIDTSSAWAGGGTSQSGLDWTFNDDFIAVLHTTTPFLSIWPFDGSNFGSEITPATPPTSIPTSDAFQAVRFSPDGTAVAIASSADKSLLVYPFDGSTLGTPVEPTSDPSSGSGGFGVAWTRGSDFVAVTFNAEPFVAVYSWDGSALGAAITPSTSSGAGSGLCATFDKNGSSLFMGGTNMDGDLELYAYAFSGSALTDRIDPDTPPGGRVIGVAVSSDNQYLATRDTDEDIDIYATGLVSKTQTQALPQVFVAG